MTPRDAFKPMNVKGVKLFIPKRICDAMIGPSMGKNMVDCGLPPLSFLREAGAGIPKLSAAPDHPLCLGVPDCQGRPRRRCSSCGERGHYRPTCKRK